MTNFQVYKKTLSFSFLMFVVGLLALAILVGTSVGGFYLANTSTDKALIGLAVGFAIGVVLVVLINYLIINRIKAAQIAMMAKGVTDGKLPDHVFSGGFKEVKGRFAKLTLFFFVIGAIKGVFNQIGRGINRFGTAVGGDTGNAITGAINTGIQVLIGYLADCCLGWVMYNKNESMAKAACEGAVIFFKHGRTLIKNIGRIVGMGLLSFLVICGGIFGMMYGISTLFPGLYDLLIQEISEAAIRSGGTVPYVFTQPFYLMLIVSAFAAVMLWSMIHSVVGRPFILVGVLRNFMASGLADRPKESDFAKLDSASPRFRKLHNSTI